MIQKIEITILSLFLMILLFACGGTGQTVSDQNEPLNDVVQSESLPTETSVPSPTDEPTATVEPTAIEEPTATDEPTATTEPTATEAPTLTPTPEGLIFRDDFSEMLAEGWRWENENPDRWSFTEDGWLEITADDTWSQGGEYPFSNMLVRDLPSGDVVITAHLEASPDTNFQQASIIIWENDETKVVVNRGFCAPCGGSGFFFDYIVPGVEPNSYQLPGFEETDVYLRMEVTNDQISVYYAVNEDEWVRFGRFGNFFDFNQVGLMVANIDVGGVDDDLLARFDWFEIKELK